MLVHQLKRLGSPAFLVTTHEGQHFPNLYLQPMPTSAPSPPLRSNPLRRALLG